MLIRGRRLHLLYIKAFACAQLNDYPFLMCYDKDDWVLNLLALLHDHFQPAVQFEYSCWVWQETYQDFLDASLLWTEGQLLLLEMPRALFTDQQ